MRFSSIIFIAFLIVLTFSSCSDDDDNNETTKALDEGVNITLRNTLQNPDEAEGTYASIFGQPDDAYDEFSTLSNTSIEFATALAQTGTPAGDVNGLYTINFTENTIEYTLIAAEDDPFWLNVADVFGLIPAGKFDRYYYTFSEPHNISGFSSNHSSINLRIDSDTVIVVEIGEGFNVSTGATFRINLN